MNVSQVSKAVMAAAVAGLGSVNLALADNHLTAKELIEAAIVTLSAFAAVYAVPNAAAARPVQPSPEVPRQQVFE